MGVDLGQWSGSSRRGCRRQVVVLVLTVDDTSFSFSYLRGEEVSQACYLGVGIRRLVIGKLRERSSGISTCLILIKLSVESVGREEWGTGAGEGEEGEEYPWFVRGIRLNPKGHLSMDND